MINVIKTHISGRTNLLRVLKVKFTILAVDISISFCMSNNTVILNFNESSLMKNTKQARLYEAASQREN